MSSPLQDIDHQQCHVQPIQFSQSKYPIFPLLRLQVAQDNPSLAFVPSEKKPH
jgi:hypothetical protein